MPEVFEHINNPMHTPGPPPPVPQGHRSLPSPALVSSTFSQKLSMPVNNTSNASILWGKLAKRAGIPLGSAGTGFRTKTGFLKFCEDMMIFSNPLKSVYGSGYTPYGFRGRNDCIGVEKKGVIISENNWRELCGLYDSMIKDKNGRFKNLTCVDGRGLSQNLKGVLNVLCDYIEVIISDGEVLYGARNIGGEVIHNMLGYIEVNDLITCRDRLLCLLPIIQINTHEVNVNRSKDITPLSILLNNMHPPSALTTVVTAYRHVIQENVNTGIFYLFFSLKSPFSWIIC